MGPLHTLFDRRGVPLSRIQRRQKSDASVNYPRVRVTIVSLPERRGWRTPATCAPVTAERQFFDQVGGRFARRRHGGLHQAVVGHMRDVDDQCQWLRQAVAQPDFQQSLRAGARRFQRPPLHGGAR